MMVADLHEMVEEGEEPSLSLLAMVEGPWVWASVPASAMGLEVEVLAQAGTFDHLPAGCQWARYPTRSQ
jgi:hypothetical protein